MAVQIMGWTRSGLFEVIRPRSGPSLAERLTRPGERMKTEASAGLEALRRLLAAAAAEPGSRPRLRASAALLRWLSGAGLTGKREAEARLGAAIDTDEVRDFASTQFEVVTNRP
jgi:hypothetical protein